jgi:hypothetical protein
MIAGIYESAIITLQNVKLNCYFFYSERFHNTQSIVQL